MKATPEKTASEFALIAALLPFLFAPFISVQLESQLPSPSLRPLVVALIVTALALLIVLVLRAFELRPAAPRQLGPAALGVALAAVASVGALVATSLIN